MKVLVHPLAEEELRAAHEHYRAIRSELAAALILEIDEAILTIVEHPEAWPPAGPLARKRGLRRFPYRIVYLHDSDSITIVAFMHVRRRPGYWRKRT